MSDWRCTCSHLWNISIFTHSLIYKSQDWHYLSNKNRFILSIKSTFTLSSKMIFGFVKSNHKVQNITTLLFLSIIFLSIGTSSFETKHNPLRSFRRKSSCYCPKSDFWRSKYSEDVKFSLMSQEYRTHLKGMYFWLCREYKIIY